MAHTTKSDEAVCTGYEIYLCMRTLVVESRCHDVIVDTVMRDDSGVFCQERLQELQEVQMCTETSAMLYWISARNSRSERILTRMSSSGI
jgi:hypothetical protein